MDRLTSNKDVLDMNSYELAHNCCYVKNGDARYRDKYYDVNCRDLIKDICRKRGLWKNTDEVMIDDNTFDDIMMDYLQYHPTSSRGFIALLYRNMWAMAELRETLKQYEDSYRDSQLAVFPCKVGDTVYLKACCECVLTSVDRTTGAIECPFECDCEYDECSNGNERIFKTTVASIYNVGQGWYITVKDLDIDIPLRDIGKYVFLTREAAEQALGKIQEGN